MTLGFYHENADGALASERPKPAPCVIVFICPQPGVHRGTGHRPCGASQSWLNCWIQSSFGTEVCDITSGPLLGVSDPTVLAREELCVDWHTGLRLYIYFLGQWKTWVIWGLDLESAIAMSCFSGTWNYMFSFYQNIGGVAATHPIHLKQSDALNYNMATLQSNIWLYSNIS